ncbi:MAG: RHS repeat-associated core domain-containing protein [Solirubrobacteraceae bacterium]
MGFVACAGLTELSVGSQGASALKATATKPVRRASHGTHHRKYRGKRRASVHRQVHDPRHVRALAASSSDSESSSLDGSLSGSPLVIPGSEMLVGVTPAEAENLLRNSPEAVAARQTSSTAYEGMSSENSEKLAGETFPALINEPAGGTPPLPKGATISSYATPSAATLELPNGTHGALASVEPIADETHEGQYVPIDLSLTEAGGGFEPKTPDTGAQVLLPKHLSEGASLSALGIGMVPVGQSGSALTAEGSIDGVSVFYGDSESSQAGVLDTDTVLKPDTYGFSTETILRSERSPQKLYFKVTLPEGATLAQGSSGAVQVVAAGKVIAAVLVPNAHDAEGTSVATSMSVSGNTIALSVAHQPGQYKMPVVVDPTFMDSILDPQGCCENYNWASATTNPNALALAGGGGEYGFAMVANNINFPSGYAAGDHAYYVYPTQGESHIYEIVVKAMHERPTSQMQNVLSLASPSGKEGNEVLIPNEWENTSTVCAVWPSCEANAVSSTDKENRAYWETRAIEAGNSSYTNDMNKASVYINQEKGPQAKLDTTDPTIEGKPNPLYANTWAKEGAYVGVNAFDPGVGVNKLSLKVKLSWEAGVYTHCAGVQCNECFETTCPNGAKAAPAAVYINWSLPEGEDTIEGEAKDAAGLKATVGPATLKYDNEVPHNFELLGLPTNNEIAEETYHFTAKVKDGEGTTPSSGIKSMVVSIDGRKLTEQPSASCPLGPCVASGEWTVNGEELGAGANTLTVVATDNAGNVAEKAFTILARHATPVAMGPGSVNPQSGQLTLPGPGVSLGGGLSVGSAYRSRNLAAVSGPFGPQWGSSLAGQQSITKQPNGSMLLAGASGYQAIFGKKEASFESPKGDPNLSLSEVTNESIKELVLKDANANTSTNFRVPTGGSGEVWVPSSEVGALASEKVTYLSETTTVEGKSITRPSSVVGTVAAGITCPTGKELKELKKGCRGLLFKYATATKATGENEAEWNEYNGRLKEVVYVGYNKTFGLMLETPVEKYLYDWLGRLRVEWDPRISHALKTYYGYDSENHVTALTPPGQETWAFTYGSIAGDSNTGRLLKVTRAPNSAPLWAGTGVKNTEVPKLTGSPVVGTRMTVSDGAWTGSPVVYGYQWKDCKILGSECKIIPGATNPNYTPVASDAGHELKAVVTATNGGGSVTAGTAISGVLVGYEAVVPTYSSSFGSYGTGSGQLREPEGGLATDASGNVWVSDTYNERLEEFNNKGEFVRTVGSYGSGAGQFGWTFGVTVDSSGNVWATDEGNNRVEEFTSEGVFIKMFGWGVSNGEAKLQTCTTSCHTGLQGSGNGEFWVPEGIVVDFKGNIFVADRGNHRVQEFNSEDAYVRSLSQPVEKEGPFYLGLDPSGNIWVAYSWDNKIGEFSNEGALIRTWGVEGTEAGKLLDPYGVAVGPDGNVWVSEYGNNRVQVFSQSGEYLYGFGTKGSGAGQFNEAPHGLAFSGSYVYVLDSGIWWENTGNSRVEKWLIKEGGGTAGEQRSPQPGSTIEYNVPVSGAGAPYQLGKKEVEEGWAQKEFPTEATAVFAPDKAQGWPASDYKRATIYYRDIKGHAVNVATPSGGISTNEYNEYNEAERTLSADNRAAALKEGAKSAEVAKLLDTKNIYAYEGTILWETIGPRHLVKLTNGKEVQARSRTSYKYDEGAPTEGGPYRLVTKMTQGAQIEGEAEQDIRTTTTSYSGQSNLGWKLRKPTSVTTDPSGLKLTNTTFYDETSGNVTEVRGPKSAGAESPHNIKTIYYSAAKNTSYPSCGEHAEWANLICETLPAKQPETGGLPALPVTNVLTYNTWGEPLMTEITSGASTRTITDAYDEAGRPETSETTSSVGTALPKVTNKFDEHTGALIEQSTSTQSLKSAFNNLGQLISYTDADGNISTYEYEAGNDYRLTKVNDGKGIQTYAYDGTTGLIKELTDSSAGTFTPGYDVEGNVVSENYPNGLLAKFGLSSVDQATGLTYKKETHCTEKCEWFTETEVPSIHGQWVNRAGSLGTHAYVYDAAGRLTESQSTPTGAGCITRRYGFDEDANQTSLTTYQPNAKNECATETSTSQTHSYDEGDRLLDTGIGYDPFGNTTSLSAADSGGTALTSSFYVNNQLASQTQGEQTIGYNVDPARRTREIVSTGKVVASEIQHYAGSGANPAWTGETAGNWTRNVYAFGGLAAIEHNGATPTLQLANLHGDIVATVEDSETAALSPPIKEASDYGVPATTSPPPYSWLGADALRTELPSGIVAMGARSYVAQLGRFLQTDPVPGGSANAYAYTYGDPVNSVDVTGAYTASIDSFDESYTAGRATEAANIRAAERAAEEAAARAEEEQKAREAYEAMMGISHTEEGAPEALGGSAGWACEYAAETGQEGEGCPAGGSSSKASAACFKNSKYYHHKGECRQGEPAKPPAKKKKCENEYYGGEASAKAASSNKACESGAPEEMTPSEPTPDTNDWIPDPGWDPVPVPVEIPV